jgi:hypothetical protein
VTAEPEEPTVVAPRRGRKPTVEPEGETSGGTVAKKGRKAATAEPEEAEETIMPLPAPAKRGARKGAVAASENEAEADDEPQPQPRRGRTPRAAAAAAAVPTKTAARGKNDDEGAGAGASRAKRGTKANAADAEVLHDEDPLDSIDQEETEPAAAIPKSKGRKKAAAVKDDVEGENLEEKLPSTTRGMKAKTTAPKMPPARARAAAKKTPATAPAAIPQGVDKENTPGSEASSGVDPDEPAEKVKVRVSKTARKAASGTAASTAARSAKVNQEMMEDAPESKAPRARVMRATRARTRT